MKRFLTTDSLEKVFPDKGPKRQLKSYNMLKNEMFHFQACFYSKTLVWDCRIELESEISEFLSVRYVEPMPSHLYNRGGDRYVLKRKNGSSLYPELLRPVRHLGDFARPKLWTTWWITVNGQQNALPTGKHQIRINVYGKDKQGGEGKDIKIDSCIFELEVIDAALPKSDLRYTRWVHFDCISHQHSKEIFSEEYYSVLNNYIKSAVSHGMTMLYTPLFTPALDTRIGGERKTAQLVDITVNEKGDYLFSFDRLKRYMDNAKNLGIQYYELSHIATQWGAYACPKIIAKTPDGERKIFGWETSSVSKEYIDFLNLFLEKLKIFLDENEYSEYCYFHISDEPRPEHMERFKTLHSVVIKHFPNVKIMDALSHVEFFDSGVINEPICSTSCVKCFKGKRLKSVYYCCGMGVQHLSNTYFNLPSLRNRILGLQLYKNQMEGFLHWGFNFYNSALSDRQLNPYFETDGGGTFESGDSFVVYPYKDGVLESLRHEVFYDGLQDRCAIQLLERLTDKSFVEKFLKELKIKGFTKYSRNEKKFLKFRKKLNEKIREKVQTEVCYE